MFRQSFSRQPSSPQWVRMIKYVLCISTSQRMHALLELKFQISNQRVGVKQLLGVTLNRWQTNFFLCFSSWALHHEPYIMSLLYAWWKRYFFIIFKCFFVFDHANTCTSMRLLVKIHNKYVLNVNINAKGENTKPFWHYSTKYFPSVTPLHKYYLNCMDKTC